MIKSTSSYTLSFFSIHFLRLLTGGSPVIADSLQQCFIYMELHFPVPLFLWPTLPSHTLWQRRQKCCAGRTGSPNWNVCANIVHILILFCSFINIKHLCVSRQQTSQERKERQEGEEECKSSRRFF